MGREERREENMRAERRRGKEKERRDKRREMRRGRREVLTKAEERERRGGRKDKRRGDKWRGENRTRQTKGRMHAEVWQSTPFIILSI